MHWDIEWDDQNVLHLTRHGVSVLQVEQAVAAADGFRKSKRRDGRIEIRSSTDGGMRLLVIADLVDRDTLRPVTAWRI